MIIKVENTAISNGVAQSVKGFVGRTQNPVLDYGAGKLRNAKYLVEQGFNVSVLDIPEQVNKWSEEDKSLFENIYTTLPEEQFQTIFNTFVLNVVPSEDVRKEILANIHSLLTPNGNVIIEVRRDKGIMNSKHIEEYNDGFILGNGNIRTFQKPFTPEYIKELVNPYFYITKLKITSDSIIVIGEKKL